MSMTEKQLQHIIEAALMVAGRPLTIQHLQKLFDDNNQPDTNQIKAGLSNIRQHYQDSGI